MNKIRRKQINEIIDALEIAMSSIESVRDDEQEYLDNIPENLQGSDRYSIAEDAVDNLDNAYDSIQEVIDYLSAAAD